MEDEPPLNIANFPERLQRYLREIYDDHFQRHIIKQWRGFFGGLVECECGRIVGTRDAFRCFYCGMWYCSGCCEIHFGVKLDDYHTGRVNRLRLENNPNEWDFEI